MTDWRGRRIAFVTGKLAAPALEAMLPALAERFGIVPSLHVQKISVAALMTPAWLVGKLTVPAGTDAVLLPGACSGDAAPLAAALGLPVERGPADLADLADHFGGPAGRPESAEVPADAASLEILAEVNHANRLAVAELVAVAERHRTEGADVIDLGATPGEPWPQLADAVAALRSAGLRVSIDSFDADEVAVACRAGAELVLSVNGSNLHRAADWGAEVVVLPDRHQEPDWLASLERNAAALDRLGVRHRLDPVLDPIGFGFAAALGRYLEVRRRFPGQATLMGTGNLTELTECDSGGVNALLAGFCIEAGVTSVLTTAVAGWAAGSVGELDAARRLMARAVRLGRVPKHLDSRLVMLRGGRRKDRGAEELARLQAAVKDPNWRLFADGGDLVALNADRLERDPDAFRLFSRLGVTDPGHAFYLGWELMKATLANQLGKRYTQDRELPFGLLTVPEESHRGEGGGPA